MQTGDAPRYGGRAGRRHKWILIVGTVAVLFALVVVAGKTKRAEPEKAARGAPSAMNLPLEHAPRPAGSAELALVAPLVVGSTLEGFSVMAIHAVDRGHMSIVCRKERVVVELMIALAEEGGEPPPPARAGRYAIFYSLRRGTPEDGERLTKALALVLEANQGVPPPPGIGAFEPLPIPI